MAKGKASIFSKIMLGFNALAVLLLLLSYLAAFISPAQAWYFGILGLAYPVLLICNVLFIIFWLLLWKRYVFISLFAILLGFFDLWHTFPIHLNKKPLVNTDGHLVKLMSYNVRLFDLYNWSHNIESRAQFFEFLKKEQPKIICFQEYYTEGPKGTLHNTDTLTHILNAKNSHIEISDRFGDDGNMGMATFTHYPIVGKGKISFTESTHNSCIYTDIAINTDTIRVYNIHLQSIRFQPEDYEYVKEVNKDKEKADLDGTRKIMGRLKIAFVKRAKQVDILSDHIKHSPYPVLVCGDFNDSPSSYSYHNIKGDLKDAFVENATGMGNTYNGIFPSFRIDYMLYDNRFSSSFFKIHKKKMSDHYAISCAIDLKPNKNHD
jgi:endonuclease/exonuclease/phosphatase family metal-dependent hydrolase